MPWTKHKPCRSLTGCWGGVRQAWSVGPGRTCTIPTRHAHGRTMNERRRTVASAARAPGAPSIWNCCLATGDTSTLVVEKGWIGCESVPPEWTVSGVSNAECAEARRSPSKPIEPGPPGGRNEIAAGSVAARHDPNRPPARISKTFSAISASLRALRLISQPRTHADRARPAAHPARPRIRTLFRNRLESASA